MALLIVTYDLKGVGKDYSPFYEAIKGCSDSWSHYISDFWIIKTSKTPKEITDIVNPHLEAKKDFLFVTEITRSYYGWLPKNAWDWLEKHGGD